MTTSEIKLKITVDENQLPHKIEWEAPDAKEGSICKSMMLALWDEKENNTMRIDLWTKEMPVDQMRVFVHQTLIGIRASYLKATQDVEMGESFQQFCDYFSDELKLGKAQRTKE